MNLNLNIPSVDKNASVEGVWVDFTNEISFLIAREGIPEYVNAVKESYAKYQIQIENGSMSDEESDEKLVESIAEHLLLNWKGLKNGVKTFPYSKENAIKLLLDDSYFELRKWVVKQTRDLENFRSKKVKK